MSKEYLVIRGGRVVYAPGHYDEEGAAAVAMTEAEQHPRSLVYVVKIIDSFTLRNRAKG